ncbi:MAG: PilZ domain-containing protein [Elusimicrobia bacterium]|nr:PilZ domain-containing protein [Elusimicrobiota bacterium]
MDRRKHPRPNSTDRRVHVRFPVVSHLIEPVNLRYELSNTNGSQETAQPAVLTNLSAGGLLIVTFMEPPHAKRLEMDINLPGLHHILIEGKIIRIHTKGEVHTVAIAFTKIAEKDKNNINRMAQDYVDCDTRISLNLPEACVPTCTCHLLCSKPQKAPHWPPKV